MRYQQDRVHIYIYIYDIDTGYSIFCGFGSGNENSADTCFKGDIWTSVAFDFQLLP